MPAELDDIELRSVQLQQSQSRDSISSACDIRRVPTDKGEISVAIQGDTTKPAILTLHDLGLNCKFEHVNKIPMSQLISRPFSRCIDLQRILQLSHDACPIGQLLCLPCDRTRSGGGRRHLCR